MFDFMIVLVCLILMIITIMNWFTCQTVDYQSNMMGRLYNDVMRLKLSDERYEEYYRRKLEIEEEIKKEFEK